MQNYNYPEDLQHYGVKGMKWGVKRDIRLIANSRRNKAVKEARDKYKTGRISKETRNARIKRANESKKNDIETMTNRMLNAKTDVKKARVENSISRTVVKEVPDYKVKRGATKVHKILSDSRIKGLGIASAVGIVTANPALAIASASGMAVEIGAKYVTDIGIDKLS